MRRGGTDMLAVACIVGGGVVAGGVTLALASGPAVPSLECAAYVGPEARVVTRLGDEGVVVVRPDVRVREVRECMATEAGEAQSAKARATAQSLAAHGEVDRVRRDVEQARREADRVREEIERVRDRVRRSAELTEAERSELIALELAEVARQERAGAGERARMAREQARVEREIARRVRENARGPREQARLQREAARLEREAARLEREIAVEARERALEGRQRAVEVRARAGLDRARAVELRERVVSPALPAVGQLRLREARVPDTDAARADEPLDGMELTGSLAEGLRIRLPDRSFRISFRGLEGLQELSALEELGDDVDLAALEEALERQLEVLESLDFQFDGLDPEIAEQIEGRIDEEMRLLEERLERLRGEDGG